MVAVCISLAAASILFAERNSILSWIAGLLFVLAAGVGHAVVFWKIDRDYRKR
jgi:hypothetical protein